MILYELDIDFDIIGLCETRLNNDISSLYKLQNFTSFLYNKSTKAGGVAIYLRKKYAGIILENYSFQLPHVESLLITVTKPYKFIVGIVYKPPNASTDDFLQFINDTAEYLITQNVPCYLLGDFNINLLKDEKKANDLINLLYSHNFFPTVTKPIRVTKHSASLIDHIWSNNLQNLEASGILYRYILE